MSAKPDYVVVQRYYGAYEVWERCTQDGCDTFHTCVSTSKSELEARRIARSLGGEPR